MEAENPPQVLDTYIMSVTQGDGQITIHSRIEGDPTLARNKTAGKSPSGGIMRGRGMGCPVTEVGEVGPPSNGRGCKDGPVREVGEVDPPHNAERGPFGPGIASGRPRVLGVTPPRPPQGGGLSALATVVPSATYTLDELETTANVGGRFPGEATVKAKWKNDGKVLELSMVQKTRDGRKITTHERWELEEGGMVLRVQRSIEGARGKDKLKLAFKRLASSDEHR